MSVMTVSDGADSGIGTGLYTSDRVTEVGARGHCPNTTPLKIVSDSPILSVMRYTACTPSTVCPIMELFPELDREPPLSLCLTFTDLPSEEGGTPRAAISFGRRTVSGLNGRPCFFVEMAALHQHLGQGTMKRKNPDPLPAAQLEQDPKDTLKRNEPDLPMPDQLQRDSKRQKPSHKNLISIEDLNNCRAGQIFEGDILVTYTTNLAMTQNTSNEILWTQLTDKKGEMTTTLTVPNKFIKQHKHKL